MTGGTWFISYAFDVVLPTGEQWVALERTFRYLRRTPVVLPSRPSRYSVWTLHPTRGLLFMDVRLGVNRELLNGRQPVTAAVYQIVAGVIQRPHLDDRFYPPAFRDSHLPVCVPHIPVRDTTKHSPPQLPQTGLPPPAGLPPPPQRRI